MKTGPEEAAELAGRRGIALALTLLAMVMLGIVIAGVFFGSSQEFGAGQNLLRREQAFAAAEHGLASQLAEWEEAGAVAMRDGESYQRTVEAQEGVTITTVLTRLSSSSFWLVSESRAGPNREARAGTAAIVRLAIPDLRPLGALVLRTATDLIGRPLIQGSVSIDGNDVAPGGWSDCEEDGAPVAGIVIGETSLVMQADSVCMPDGCLRGSPAVLADPGIGDSSVMPLDATEWARLASRANVRLAGGSLVGDAERPLRPYIRDERCDTTIDHNWGDPSRGTVCGGYFPIVYVRGDLSVTGGHGQGTLLIDGDLMLSGGATFVGAVFVRGALRTGAGGARILGITRVGGRSAVPSELRDGLELRFSRCAASTALGAAALPELLPRSWIEVH